MRRTPLSPNPRSFLWLFFVALGVLILFVSRTVALDPAPSQVRASTIPTEPPFVQDVAIAATPTPEPSPTPVPTPTAIPAPLRVSTSAGEPLIGAPSAVVMDEQSGAVLYEKHAHARRAPASITKIVTAIVAIERGSLDDMVTVEYDPAELVDSTVMGINPGDKLSLEDLLYGLMLPSGNDAAIAIANHIAGSESAFADLMNAQMARLGLKDSHFVNAHGLDHEDHYSSAYDMAMVSRYAMRNPTFRALAAAKLHAVVVETPDGIKRYDVFNLNRLLFIYQGADGVKVGFTDNALKTIVGSVTRDGHRVFVAVMGSWNLWTDTPPLLDYAFRSFAWPGNGRDAITGE